MHVSIQSIMQWIVSSLPSYGKRKKKRGGGLKKGRKLIWHSQRWFIHSLPLLAFGSILTSLHYELFKPQTKTNIDDDMPVWNARIFFFFLTSKRRWNSEERSVCVVFVFFSHTPFRLLPLFFFFFQLTRRGNSVFQNRDKILPLSLSLSSTSYIVSFQRGYKLSLIYNAFLH